MTAAPLDLDALEALKRAWEDVEAAVYGNRVLARRDYDNALRAAAPALFAAARERDKLREALEAAEPILLAESMGLPRSIETADQTRDALAKARAALGREP